MTNRSARQSGKINPVIVIMVLVLAGLGVILGWWFGQEAATSSPGAKSGKGSGYTAPQPDRKKSPPVSESVILEDKLADIAEGAMPAVANIFTEKVVRSNPHGQMFDDPFFRFFFGPGKRGIPKERRERSLGSGVVVSDDGYIMTNNHVVEGADTILVALSDKSEYRAELVGTDPQTDLALLKIDAEEKLPYLPLGNSDDVRVGQVVLAIGNPFGLSSTVTMGIVSARGRSQMGITDYEDFIQTDAAINPGNSGGALIDLSGELVGINTAIFSRTGGNQGIGFAIPSNLGRYVMESIINLGDVRRGWLGVSIQSLTPDLAEQFGIGDVKGGAVVAEVIAGTPADEAGIEAGDVIVTIDGEPVESYTDLRNQIAEIAPDTEIELGLYREGKKEDVTVKLGERPGEESDVRPGQQTPEPSDEEADAAGMTVTNLTPSIADRLGIEYSDDAGVVVIDVDPASRAGAADVKVGDIIFRMNRMKVKNVNDFKAAASRAGDGSFLLHLRRGGSNLFMVVPAE